MKTLRHLATNLMAVTAIALLGVGVSYATNINKIPAKATPSAALPAATQSEVGKVRAGTVLVLQTGSESKLLAAAVETGLTANNVVRTDSRTSSAPYTLLTGSIIAPMSTIFAMATANGIGALGTS